MLKVQKVLFIAVFCSVGLLFSQREPQDVSMFDTFSYQSVQNERIDPERLYELAQPKNMTDQQHIRVWIRQKNDQLCLVQKTNDKKILEPVGIQVLRCMTMFEGPQLCEHTTTSSKTMCRVRASYEYRIHSPFRQQSIPKSYVCAAFVANTMRVQELIEKYDALLHVPKSYLIKKDLASDADDSNVFVVQEYVPNFRTLTNKDTDTLEKLTFDDITALYFVIKESGALWDIQRNLGWDGEHFWCVDLEPRGMTSELLFFNKHSGMVKNNVLSGLRQLLWFFQKMPAQREYIKDLMLQDPDFSTLDKTRYTKV